MGYKSISELTRNDKFQIGAALIQRKGRLSEQREFLNSVLQVKTDEEVERAYDIELVGQPLGMDVMLGGNYVPGGAEAYTKEMQIAASKRHRKALELTSILLDEQIQEVEDVLEEISKT